MIKAIETQYKGYRFRSRLEARWAVFFDTLGVQWEYEPEGFDLGDGVWYLPDFKVTHPKGGATWFEVKAAAEAMSEDEWVKVARFAVLQPDPVLLLFGVPDEASEYRTPSDFCTVAMDNPEDEYVFCDGYLFSEVDTLVGPRLTYEALPGPENCRTDDFFDAGVRFKWLSRLVMHDVPRPGFPIECLTVGPSDSEAEHVWRITQRRRDTPRAVDAARSARFGHGGRA